MKKFSNKIFVTGIYGAGKSYFCDYFMKNYPGYKLMRYDHLYNYTTRNDTRVYSTLNANKKIIMDACPAAFTKNTKIKLENFCNNTPTTLIVLNISLENWLERVQVKKDGCDEEKRTFSYNWYHEKELPILLDNNFEYVYHYDIWENKWIN